MIAFMITTRTLSLIKVLNYLVGLQRVELDAWLWNSFRLGLICIIILVQIENQTETPLNSLKSRFWLIFTESLVSAKHEKRRGGCKRGAGGKRLSLAFPLLILLLSFTFCFTGALCLQELGRKRKRVEMPLLPSITTFVVCFENECCHGVGPAI